MLIVTFFYTPIKIIPNHSGKEGLNFGDYIIEEAYEASLKYTVCI